MIFCDFIMVPVTFLSFRCPTRKPTFRVFGGLIYIDLEDMYCNHAQANFDLDAIRDSDMNFAYDAMFGSGMNVVKRLLPQTVEIFKISHLYIIPICTHCHIQPSAGS